MSLCFKDTPSDSIGCDSSYSSPLLVGFDLTAVNHDGRSSSMVSVGHWWLQKVIHLPMPVFAAN